jgi:multiple sugar transport system permease protein
VWKSFPFFAITILAALQAIPAELYEAAKVDGARAWHQFRYVTWPSIKRPAMLAVLLNALWTFREFDIIYASTGGGPRGDRDARDPGLSRGVRQLPLRDRGGARRADALTATVVVLLSMRRLKDEFQ